MSFEVSRYDYKWLRDEACGDFTCHVVERYPRYEHSGYGKQVVWTDVEHCQTRKLEFHDREGALLKTLALTDFKRYRDAFLRARLMDMANHQNGKSTTQAFSEMAFGVGLSERDFSKDRLARVR